MTIASSPFDKLVSCCDARFGMDSRKDRVRCSRKGARPVNAWDNLAIGLRTADK